VYSLNSDISVSEMSLGF